MNFISSDLTHSHADPGLVLTIDQAHVWRSKIIDKCAEAERQVLRLIRLGDARTSARAPFSQKLKSMKNLLAEGIAPKRAATISQLLEKLQPLSDLRSELAHSTMTVSEIEGARVAVLHNAAAEGTAQTIRNVLTLEQFKECHKDLSNIANSLRQEADRN